MYFVVVTLFSFVNQQMVNVLPFCISVMSLPDGMEHDIEPLWHQVLS